MSPIVIGDGANGSTAGGYVTSELEILQYFTALSGIVSEEASKDVSEDSLLKIHRVRQYIALLSADTVPTAEVFRVLTPQLFLRSDHESSVLPNALQILTLLVTSNATKFYKQASRSMADFTANIKHTTDTIVVSDDLARLLTGQLVGEDVEVTNNASKSIVALCSCTDYFASDNMSCMAQRFIPILYDLWCHHHTPTNSNDNKNNSVVQVRCATTIVRIATISNDSFAIFTSSGSSRLLLEMLRNGDDPLLQMSMMDLTEQLLVVLATTITDSHSLRISWLFSEPVSSLLLGMANNTDCMFQGQALVMVSSLCHLLSHRPQQQEDDALLHQLSTALLIFHLTTSSSNEVARMQFIHAVSSFAASGERAMALILQPSPSPHNKNNESLREAWLSLPSRPKLKAVVLTSVARCLLESSGVKKVVLLELYAAIGLTNSNSNTTTSDLLLSVARTPIPETRIAAYTLMRALVDGTGALGVRSLLNAPGVLELLMDDGSEHEKEGKEAKYGVVEAIVKAEGADTMLHSEVLQGFRQVVKNGPYHVKTRRWDVMVDE